MLENPIEQLALDKCATKKNDASTLRASVASGKYDVDFTVRITGTMSVADSYATTPTVSIPLLETLALMVKRAGFTRERSMEIIREAVTGALLAGLPGGKGAIAAEVAEVAEWVETVKAEICATLPKATRTGPVRCKLTVAQVGAMASETLTPEAVATAGTLAE